MIPETGWLCGLGGRFLVFDGPDGSGKSTQCQHFMKRVQAAGVTVCHVREPGGTPVGERIREVLLDRSLNEMHVRCEMLLYMASRAQLITEKIIPAINQGQLVLADRFISSTLAYQGTAGGLDVADILTVGRIALQQCWPDLVILFDVDEVTASRRLSGQPKRSKHQPADLGPSLFADRIEMKEASYHRAVRQAYLDQAQRDPDRYLVIDATADPDAVFNRMLAKLHRWTTQAVG